MLKGFNKPTKFAKPWFRPARGLWYVTLNGRQHNLGADKVAAFERYHQLMGMEPEQRLVGTTVAELLDAFLGWCELHRKPATYDWYRRYCQNFLNLKKVNPQAMVHLTRSRWSWPCERSSTSRSPATTCSTCSAAAARR